MKQGKIPDKLLGGTLKEVQPYVPEGVQSSQESEQPDTEVLNPEDLSPEQEEFIRSICRLIRRHIKLEGAQQDIHRDLKDAFAGAVQKKNIQQLNYLICNFSDILQGEISSESEKASQDANRALKALIGIEGNDIPWTILAQQLNIAIDDALSASFDRIHQTGIIYPKELGGGIDPEKDNEDAVEKGIDDQKTVLPDGKFRSIFRGIFKSSRET